MELKVICCVLMILFVSSTFASDDEAMIDDGTLKFHGIRAERGVIKNALKGAAAGAAGGAIANKLSGSHSSTKDSAMKGAGIGAVANTAMHAMSGSHKNH